MALKIDVKSDIDKMLKSFHHLRKEVERAIPRALNKTVGEVRAKTVAELKKEVGQTTGISTSAFRNSLQETKASRFRLYATLTASGRALPLIGFKARATARGVSATAWGKRKVYKGAFIAKMPSGHKGVFKRVPGKFMGSRKGRTKHSEAIKELFGPSLPKEFTKLKILGAMERHAVAAWKKHWAREVAKAQISWGRGKSRRR